MVTNVHLSQSKLSMKSKKFFDKSLKLTNLNVDIDKSQNYAVIRSEMFILSQSQLSNKSKQFFDKSLKLTNLNEDIEKISQNYAIILSHSKLSIKSKKFFNNSLKLCNHFVTNVNFVTI